MKQKNEYDRYAPEWLIMRFRGVIFFLLKLSDNLHEKIMKIENVT